ncbi:hypothetical protein L226DRAFT_607444 [Lentinus tigrinus ALCF2SS1-7]|uniref:Uncharacterized protein n=1 Tax=Lentinus tigrinus ALCF2SS1-6 TaxID=1328759 RepID=A0A5C2S115_9APHY|nr:hypothetical protein L227DRAFT_655751 [Lentinus tigrinus ALCF2SS1-6]RPD82300.1 hypothetical protein L226DRAFT_607444 [Lentinus tigrinus ALCF2SS1-7]
MLSRLSSPLPSATASLARSATLRVQRVPTCLRFNSSEAAQPSESSEPKKRGVPLAQNLGDINIRNRTQGTRADGQQRTGPRREGGHPRGQQRQNAAPRDDRQPGNTFASPRSDNRRPRDGQRQPRPPRARDVPQSEGDVQQAASVQPTQRSPVAIPKSSEIELGNLDELFGSPTSPSSQAVSTTPRKDVTPSQARVQLFLEKTAGDYSRYVPRPFSTTDVRKLGPVKLGEFVLSRKRDAGLAARQNVLAVVQKFAGGQGVRAS